MSLERSKVATVASLSILLMAAGQTSPDNSYRTSRDTLACGSITAVIASTCARSGTLQCRKQDLAIEPAKVSVNTHPDPVMVEISHDKDVLLVGWSCVTSRSGQAFILLDYVCSFDTAACSEDEQKEDWQQLVDSSGHNLDMGHDLRKPGHQAVLEKAGLARLMDPPGIAVIPLGFTLK